MSLARPYCIVASLAAVSCTGTQPGDPNGATSCSTGRAHLTDTPSSDITVTTPGTTVLIRVPVTSSTRSVQTQLVSETGEAASTSGSKHAVNGEDVSVGIDIFSDAVRGHYAPSISLHDCTAPGDDATVTTYTPDFEQGIYIERRSDGAPTPTEFRVQELSVDELVRAE